MLYICVIVQINAYLVLVGYIVPQSCITIADIATKIRLTVIMQRLAKDIKRFFHTDLIPCFIR